jgi:hypothetical protein
MDAAALRDWIPVATGLATLCAVLIGLANLSTILRNSQLQTNLAIIQAERSVWQAALAKPELAPNVIKERWGDGERLFVAMLLDHYEGLYFQYRRGAIPQAYWRGLERAMIEHICSPTIRTVWESHKDLYWPEFARHIEAAIKRVNA